MSPPIINTNDTRKNLKNGFKKEDIFVKKFFKKFKNNTRKNILSYVNCHLNFNQMKFFYEVPVSGYGVSDLLMVAWNEEKSEFPKTKDLKEIESFIEKCNPKIFTFEMKLNGISQCITQSFSYKFYSHFSFAVMPNSFKKNIEKRTDYKKLNIGFLTMDDKNIYSIYKPKEEPPIFKNIFPKVISKLLTI